MAVQAAIMGVLAQYVPYPFRLDNDRRARNETSFTAMSRPCPLQFDLRCGVDINRHGSRFCYFACNMINGEPKHGGSDVSAMDQ